MLERHESLYERKRNVAFLADKLSLAAAAHTQGGCFYISRWHMCRSHRNNSREAKVASAIYSLTGCWARSV